MRKKLMVLVMSLLTTMNTLASTVVIADDVSVSASVTKYMTATFQYSAVAFGSLTSGTSDNTPTPDSTVGTYNVTIDTNFDYQLQANATDFTGAVSSFGASNMNLGMNATAGNLVVGDSVALSSSPQTIETSVPYTQTADYHGYWVDVPASQYAEAYSSTVTVTYSNL